MKEVEAHGDLVEEVARTFRANGYHGTTLSIVSDRTGLGRSSIYHHFGRGKLEMAQRSLDAIERFIGTLGETASATHLSSREKWEMMRAMLHKHYEGGMLGCLLAVFALEDVPDDLRARTKKLFESWIGATAELYRVGDVGSLDALAIAERHVAFIQGALVLSRAQDDPAPFEQAMTDIAEALKHCTEVRVHHAVENDAAKQL